MPKLTWGTAVADKNANLTSSNGGLTLTAAASANLSARMINVTSVASQYLYRTAGAPRWVEWAVTSAATSATSPTLCAGSGTFGTGTVQAQQASTISIRPSGAAWQAYLGTGASGSTFGTFAVSTLHRIGLVVDFNNLKAKFYVNGTPGAEITITSAQLTAMTLTMSCLISGEINTINVGYDSAGVYTPATHLSAYLTDYPNAIPWQDDLFRPTITPVISPRPLAHIRL